MTCIFYGRRSLRRGARKPQLAFAALQDCIHWCIPVALGAGVGSELPLSIHCSEPGRAMDSTGVEPCTGRPPVAQTLCHMDGPVLLAQSIQLS